MSDHQSCPDVEPTTLRRKTSIQAKTIYASLLTMLLVYGCGIIPLIAPIVAEKTIYRLRVIEEYVLLFIILFCFLLRRSLVLRNVIPSMIAMAYFLLALLVNGEYELYYVKIIIFYNLHYIAFATILRRLDKKVVFTAFLIFGLFASIFFLCLVSLHQSVMDVTLPRVVTERLGFAMNVNTISILFVSISALLVAMKQNLVISKRIRFFFYAYHFMVLSVLFLSASIAAFCFFVLAVGYDLYRVFNIRRLAGLIVVLLICASVFGPLAGYISSSTLLKRMSIGATYQIRVSQMKRSISIFEDNPIFGVGRSRLVALEVSEIGSVDHNFFTGLLGSQGILGVCVFVYFLFSFLGSHGKTFPGIYLLRFCALYFFFFAPSGGLVPYAAVLIAEFSRPYIVSGNAVSLPLESPGR